MQTYINSFQIIDRKLKTFKIFGYASKGMPGVEVVGFGKQSRLIKEKLIYFTKTFGMRINNKKYVLCLDESDSRLLRSDDLMWFEVPSLILFWTLSDVVPLKNIHDCFASGKMRATGEFEDYQLDTLARNYLIENRKILIQDSKCEEVFYISLDNLIRESIEKKKMDRAV